MDQAAGGVEDVEDEGKEEEEGAVGGEKKIEIDESLFNVDDLGDIQDELEDLDIS